MKKVNVIKNQKLTKNVYTASLDYQPDFIPGQIIELTEDPDLPTRMYSIASAPGHKSVDILYDLQELGRLTPVLAGMRSGDSLYAGKPSGAFTCGSDEKAWFIAAGTGIAPFASMILSGNTNNKILIHSGRTPDSFFYQDKFIKKLGDNYVRCCTGEGGKGLYHGRITSYIKEQKELPKDCKYYLCGSSEMVVQTRDILVERGIAFDNILSEIYF